MGDGNGDKVTLGEVKGLLEHIDKSHSNQLTDLFELVRDVRENGTVLCKQNSKDIASLKSLMAKMGVAVVVLIMSVFGLDKVVGLFIK